MNDANGVVEKIGELLAVDAASIELDAPLFSLTSSSFRIVELVIELQEEYGISFRQEDMNGVSTVGNLVELVVTRRRERIGSG